MNQSLKRSQSKLLQSNSIRSSLSRQQSRMSRNTWAGPDYDNDDNDDDDDDDDDVSFHTSSHSFSPKSPSSIHLSFQNTPRSSSPSSGKLTTPKPSWDTLKTVKFHSFKISERDDAVDLDHVNPRQPDNTPFQTPSFTPRHTPSPSNFHTPVMSRVSSKLHLDRNDSPSTVTFLLPTNSNPPMSPTHTSTTSSLLLTPSPSNIPDNITKKSSYKVELTQEEKHDAKQMLLQKVQSSRTLLKQELETSKEVNEYIVLF